MLIPSDLRRKAWEKIPCTPYMFGDGCQFYLVHSQIHHSTRLCGVATPEIKISHAGGALPGHLTRPRVPEKRNKRVKILTDRIVRMDTYPAAYGGFSDVWSCWLKRNGKPPKRVAVKAVRPAIANSKELQIKREAVKQELNVWAGLDHPNVLPLYGITYGFGEFHAFVCPWAENGTLSEYLEKFGSRLNLKKRLALLRNIAAGLLYLHSHNVVHGDLSGSNVLITKRGRACLSDFGLSTLVEVSDGSICGVSFPGNIRWAAPELLNGCQEDTPTSQLSSPQADVYSFGRIMLQTLTGRLPFHGIKRAAQIVVMLSQGYQPERELRWDGRAIPDVLWEFVKKCCATNPLKRPKSEEIFRFIDRQLSRM